MDPLDLDPGFEPQTRARSNTWPLPRPENYVEGPDEKGGVLGPPGGPMLDGPKKNSSRRNAWGNMSYADLITQAIQSTPDKRLTLAQIYEWMVQNVAYFKDKGDSNSSAGWKNSIRHNLSLHNRFMRVQNEGTGKSSWWMINPDAKPGKAARRRATSMETQKYEKKRGRVKKKVEALRNAGATPSPSSSVSEGHDLFPESPPLHLGGFQLSPDFRPRASSNASSCGGRLSPIPAVESDTNDLPPLSPIPWSSELTHLGGYDSSTVLSTNSMDRFSTENLVKSLTESMKLRNGGDQDNGFGRLADCAIKSLSNGRPSPQQQLASTGSYTLSYSQHFGTNGHGTGDYRPPSYHQQASPDPITVLSKGPSPQQAQVMESSNVRQYNLTSLQGMNNGHHPLSVQQNQLNGMQNYRPVPPYIEDPSLRAPSQPIQPMFKDIKEERLSPLLGSCGSQQTPVPTYQQHMMQQYQQHQVPANQIVSHLLYNPFPQDLDFEIPTTGLECDVDQVIEHELNVEGNLDFNFDAAVNGSTQAQPHNHQTSQMPTSRTWVH